MSLVYNNKKLIGKCSKFAIEKVQGTSPFVMLENFEPKQPQLNDNQQEMLKEVIRQYDIARPKTVLHALEHLSMIAFLLDEMEEVTEEDCIVVAQAFLDWAKEQEAE
ncbi:hypothetical protein [Enterococcus casseliflavus]|uniref:hypothetical protein n=1 Tax=Enterococcus casseliflavus TaxID=37734 RepID=UPI001CA933CE|nr:hypothetical protein [Enterococcus casseliflavus]MBZ0323554.1 hypothetical protein [Enterococcus casseliflavus]